MQNLIPITKKVHELISHANNQANLSLPLIVAIGEQSTGKSSVLETIIGKEFLPIGVSTLRPIIINLKNVMESEEDFATFDHIPNKKYTNFDHVRRELKFQMGQEELVSYPIVLNLHSKNFIDLTLIDLPEMSPSDKLISDLIYQKNCVILSVSSATSHLVNSDTLKLVSQADPKGERTIKVLTKLDLVEYKGMHLKSPVHLLKSGYVGIVCRSQRDILDGKSIKAFTKEEEGYFAQHPIYSTLKDCCGIQCLYKELYKLLKRYVMDELPKIKGCLTTALHAKLQELASMGMELCGIDMYNTGVLRMISKFVENYQAELEGTAVHEKATKELQGGARIHYIFHEIYDSAMEEIGALDGLTDEDIRTSIMNSKSLHPSLFIPEKAFETLVKEQIKKLLNPSLLCLQMVSDELRRIVINSDIPELSNHKKMKGKMQELMLDLLKKYTEPTEEMIRNLVKIQDAYINVYHPEVLSGNAAAIGLINRDPVMKEKENAINTLLPKKNNEVKIKSTKPKSLENEKEKTGFPFVRTIPLRATGPASSREILETEIIKQLLVSYFEMVKKNVADLVPKTIIALLVNKSKETAKNELVAFLYDNPETVELMVENVEIQEKRQVCKKAIEDIRESIHELNAIS